MAKIRGKNEAQDLIIGVKSESEMETQVNVMASWLKMRPELETVHK